MHHPSISAGGDDIDKLSGDIAQINKDIGEADLKANSNDPDERAFWRKRVESLQSDKLVLQNFMIKEADWKIERERKEAKQIDLMLERERTAAERERERERQKASKIDRMLERERKAAERERQEASKIDGLIQLGKIGDNIMLFSVSKY